MRSPVLGDIHEAFVPVTLARFLVAPTAPAKRKWHAHRCVDRAFGEEIQRPGSFASPRRKLISKRWHRAFSMSAATTTATRQQIAGSGQMLPGARLMCLAMARGSSVGFAKPFLLAGQGLGTTDSPAMYGTGSKEFCSRLDTVHPDQGYTMDIPCTRHSRFGVCHEL